MNEFKLRNRINSRIEHYSTLSDESWKKLKELQADPDCPMVTLNEAKLELCRWTSRQIAMKALRKEVEEGNFD